MFGCHCGRDEGWKTLSMKPARDTIFQILQKFKENKGQAFSDTFALRLYNRYNQWLSITALPMGQAEVLKFSSVT